ncbi:2,4-dienoyl-CoA reductase-like NADH-dependent reductase (Old Yellow Enzyme family) [Rathayibacter tanaceti]|uniref:2,4-dienoyl-CoA reductase-like NADH-dependent reductase (Old Yellow Enzyme family) n=2 Tax=Rathayibacter tanaceti TaxID=1671680 RepID=A0ACD2XHA2_9MICO|nr:alkene reductase [Rathayibacter tanaceti]QHC56366.1 alkene reductase [Rathayibacter tanaceti]TCO34891.1 2,4-dienoyl-CoA reductase-like NADH-dependent reductase (Old Yellow Enzyme family) [Rathayibacter tanaceti]
MDPFSPLTAGDLDLRNRLVLAPMTRLRSDEQGVPGPIVAEYYAQRASLGLLISEGVFPSAESKGYQGQPGIVTPEQAEGWRAVADAVHAAGGRIVMQIMNAGRVSHTAITGTERIVAPSAIAIDGQVRTPGGMQPFPVPHALTTQELATIRDEFVAAACLAVDAGFDGVEVHSANGYLLHEFLSPASNVRTDAYGGSPAARASFPIEVTRAIADEIGAGRVGIRVSPSHNIQDVLETDADDVRATYEALIDGLAPLGLAYLSVLHAEPAGEFVQDLRSRFGGVLVANSGFGSPTSREEATSLIADGHADAVAVGRPAIANPDLAERWQGGHPENEVVQATVYGGGAEGYTDYERLSA